MTNGLGNSCANKTGPERRLPKVHFFRGFGVSRSALRRAESATAARTARRFAHVCTLVLIVTPLGI
jgi:hypothetical protein